MELGDGAWRALGVLTLTREGGRRDEEVVAERTRRKALEERQ